MSFSDVFSISSKDAFYQADAKFKEELKIFSACGFFGERLIAKRKGEALVLSKTNVFFFFLEKFKGLFGCFNGADHRVVEFATLEFLLKGRKWVEQPEDFLRVQALAQKVGLFSCSKNGSSQEKQLIQDIRQTLLSPKEQEKIDDVFYREEVEKERGEASSFLDRFSIQYQKELEPFSKHINKVKDAFNQFDIQNRTKDSHVFQKDKSLTISLDEQEAMVEIAKTNDIFPIREEEKLAKHRIKELSAKEIETHSKWSTVMKVGACFIALVATGLGVGTYVLSTGILGIEYKAMQRLVDSAATSGDAYDLYLVGDAYRQRMDYANAFPWYEKAAEKGHKNSMDVIQDFQNEMGVSDSKMALVREVYDQGKFQKLKDHAIEFDQDYDYWLLGEEYRKRGDYENAFIGYKKSAERGYWRAMGALKDFQDEMKLSDSDLALIRKTCDDRIFQWEIDWAVKSGEPAAQRRVGRDYIKRNDYANAFVWYRRGAEQGNAESMEAIEKFKDEMGVSDSELALIRKAFNDPKPIVW